jgi:hypothetical protein
MKLILSNFFTKYNLINLLLSLIPLSFIAGNLVLNLNIFLLLVSAFILYRKNIIKINYYILDKIIFLFFFFLLLNGLFNNIDTYITDIYRENFTIIIKTLLFFRFLFLYLIIRFLVEKNLVNFNLFFISASICSLFVSLDIFYQLINGKDIFGFEGIGRKFSGPFGDELIAGGYLQRFSLFTFFSIPFFFNSKKKYKLSLLIAILFIMSLIILLENKTRKYFISFFIVSSLVFIFLYKFNNNIKHNFNVFHTKIVQLSKIVTPEKINRKTMPAHFKEFESFYETWLLNKYIGGGIKTFRYNCHARKNIEKDSTFKCNTHPHNYYLEILTELGIVGFVFLFIIFSLTVYISLVKKYFFKSALKNNHLITPFMLVFLAEIFPIKSTGGFFTTSNATFIFLVLSFTVALARYRNLN